MLSHPTSRPLACAFAACALVILVLLLMHPEGGGRTLTEVLQGEALTARAAGIVHGGFIVISVILLACLAQLSGLLGVERAVVVLGLAACCSGAAALMASMTLDGLVIPQVALRCLNDQAPECLASVRPVFLFCATCIRVLMPMGLMLDGAGMLCFSIALAGRGSRAIASYGVVAGLLLLVAPLRVAGLNPHVLIAGILLLCVWYLLLATTLWSRAATPVLLP